MYLLLDVIKLNIYGTALDILHISTIFNDTYHNPQAQTSDKIVDPLTVLMFVYAIIYHTTRVVSLSIWLQNR